MISSIVYVRNERFSILSGLPTAFSRRVRPMKVVQARFQYSFLLAISVAVRNEGDIVLRSGLHAGYG